jgi:hypothetical protein
MHIRGVGNTFLIHLYFNEVEIIVHVITFVCLRHFDAVIVYLAL